jgi:hypothetical protein
MTRTAQHTIAPWHKQPFASAADQRITAYRIVYGPASTPLAIVDGLGNSALHNEANADLIIAAPQLLQAAKRALFALESVVHLTGNNDLLPYVKICKHAIAAAQAAR